MNLEARVYKTPKAVRLANQEYHRKNKRAISIRKKRWYKKNREQVLQKTKEWKAIHPEACRKYVYKWSENNPEARKAHAAVRKAIRNGTLVRPHVCPQCDLNSRRIEGHHEDYSKPLDVTWACIPCHKIIHQKEEI